MPQPAPKANELIERLEGLSNNPNEFQLRKLEKEAIALLDHDASGAYTALGIIHAIRGDEPQAIAYHQKSLKLTPDSATRRLYATTLTYLNRWDDALTEYQHILQQAPSPDLLYICINLAVRAGRPLLADQFYAKLVKMVPELQSDEELKKVMHNAQLLHNTGLTEQEIAEMNAIVMEIAKEYGATIVSSETWENIWEDPYFVANDFCVNVADVDAVVDMQMALAKRLAERNPPALAKGTYHVGFLSVTQ